MAEDEPKRIELRPVTDLTDLARRETDHRLLSDPRSRASYDLVKLRSAHLSADGYWQAKNAFWQRHAVDAVEGGDARARAGSRGVERA